VNFIINFLLIINIEIYFLIFSKRKRQRSWDLWRFILEELAIRIFSCAFRLLSD